MLRSQFIRIIISVTIITTTSLGALAQSHDYVDSLILQQQNKNIPSGSNLPALDKLKQFIPVRATQRERLVDKGEKAGSASSKSSNEKASKEKVKVSLEEASSEDTFAAKTPDNKKLSSIELMYRNKQTDAVVEQFGYNFFSSQDAVDWNVPVSTDYAIGPGDFLNLYLWGDPVEILGLPGQIELQVGSDGSVFVPSLGLFPVSGLKLKEIQDLFHKGFSARFKKLSLSVTMGRMRGINVYIAGEVFSPGIATVRAISSLIEAISSRGGIKKTGSLRNIIVKRTDASVTKEITVDFYKLLIDGEPINFRLKEGDVILVPPIGETAAITGDVKRSGIYEIKQGESLSALLQYAGGTLPTAYKQRIQIERIDDHGRRIVKGNISLEDSLSNVLLKNGDFITFYPSSGMFTKFVEISGSVEHPGKYEHHPGMTLSTLLAQSIVLSSADFNAGFVIREKSGEREEVIEFIPSDVAKSLLSLSPGDKIWIGKREPVKGITISGKVKSPQTLTYYKSIKLSDAVSMAQLSDSPKKLKAEIWRDKIEPLTVYLNKLFLKYKSDDDVLLEPGDIILVKQMTKTEGIVSVRIEGEVNAPGAYELTPGMRLSDLLKQAGGYTSTAHPKSIVFLREGLRKAQEERLKINIITLEEMLAKSATAFSASEGAEEEKVLLQMNLERQKQTISALKAKAELMLGRIALEIPSSVEELKKSPEDICLEEDDYIYIPSVPNFVMIMGDVFNQVGIPYQKNKSVAYYLNQVGGVTKSADETSIYVIRANGRVISKAQSSGWFDFTWNNGRINFGGFDNIRLEEGDTIVVPTEIKVPTLWRPLIKDIVQIIFQSFSTAVLAKRL